MYGQMTFFVEERVFFVCLEQFYLDSHGLNCSSRHCSSNCKMHWFTDNYRLFYSCARVGEYTSRLTHGPMVVECYYPSPNSRRFFPIMTLAMSFWNKSWWHCAMFLQFFHVTHICYTNMCDEDHTIPINADVVRKQCRGLVFQVIRMI